MSLKERRVCDLQWKDLSRGRKYNRIFKSKENQFISKKAQLIISGGSLDYFFSCAGYKFRKTKVRGPSVI